MDETKGRVLVSIRVGKSVGATEGTLSGQSAFHCITWTLSIITPILPPSDGTTKNIRSQQKHLILAAKSSSLYSHYIHLHNKKKKRTIIPRERLPLLFFYSTACINSRKINNISNKLTVEEEKKIRVRVRRKHVEVKCTAQQRRVSSEQIAMGQLPRKSSHLDGR